MQGPKAPDPYATAAAQGNSNIQTAIGSTLLNNTNEVGPFGNLNYSQTGTQTIKDAEGKDVSVPQFTRTTTLDPAQQQLLDQQNQAGISMNNLGISQIDRLQGTLNEPFNFDGIAPRQTDWSADRQRVENALLSRLEPKFARDEATMRTRLQNQGLTPGSEIYNNDLQNLDFAKNDARQQAVLAGGAEQDRLSALDAERRNNEIQERAYLRNQPMNEVSSLLGGGQVSVPQFSAPYRQGIQGADVAGAINSNYQNQLSNYQNNATGLFGLAGTLGTAALSDERAKTDIKQIGMLKSGIPIVSFRYHGQPATQFGVIAQDVQKIMPEAVVSVGGMLHVDYAKVVAGE